MIDSLFQVVKVLSTFESLLEFILMLNLDL